MLPSIPDEIWRYIFLTLDGLQDQSDSQYEREKDIGRLSSVCRTWRDICISTSALWKRITFDDRKSNVHAELLRMGVSLARSSFQQLEASITISSSDPSMLSFVVLALEEHLTRVRKLDLSLVYLDPPHSPRLDVSTWPIMRTLEELTLENIRFHSSPEFRALLRCTPALRSLRVGGMSWIAHFLPDSGKEAVALPHLQEFTLDSYVLYTFVDVEFSIPALQRLTLLNTEYSLSWHTLLSHLSWETSPTELILSGAFPESSVSSILAFFPTIQELSLYSCPTDVVHLLREFSEDKISALRHLPRRPDNRGGARTQDQAARA
ncbi:hypothetical protein CALCODRAFT_507385 [Calocera cornea HHB12733]|uniref:F-box domain-containing protein n=1 Tax=Calocera cornea HHB12733 TaxID=1353952 RepID=A0A165HS81_9BASI|nr:hypothetical protein CALCODRAFT_507385 [Calocera cornea HHB12733]